MHPERLAYTFLGFFLTTIFCLQWWQHAVYPRALWIALGMIALNAFLVRRARGPVLAGLLGITIALLTVARTTHVPTFETIDTFADGKYVTIHGVIVEEPDRRPMQTKYTIEVQKLTRNDEHIDHLQGRILATDRNGWPQYQYGDEVEVSGTLEKPGMIDTFHYDRYLSRDDVYSVMYFANIRKVSSGHGNAFFALLFHTKELFENQINRLYAEPHASFLAGLLTGSRKGIPEHLMENFNTTGLTHIIAISGYNITIVITMISGALFWLPLRWRFIPAASAIIVFTLFVGASAAVVRASIMGILGILALHVGRVNHVRLTILWALFAMLAWNPKFLWYDAGFQLSFLAVLGLTECAPLLDRWFKCVPAVLGMREALQMTISAQITAVPLIVLLFGRLSLIAPVANLLVAPAIPPAMLFGFLGTVLSTICFPLGQLFAFIGWGFMQWIVLVATALAHIPFASVDVPAIGTTCVVLYYTALVTIVARRRLTTYIHTLYSFLRRAPARPRSPLAYIPAKETRGR
ncbi:MAG: ComEC/Rec2 family competence protein [Candidatus Peribacteraceae bacterium]